VRIPFINSLDRSEVLAAIGLVVVLLLLSCGAVLSRLAIPDLEPVKLLLVLLIFAILAIAGLGVCVIYYMRHCRELETASGADNHAALHDPLTGAANRRQFEQHLDAICAEKTPTAVLMMLDLDRFKPVNDLYGHAAGDELLKQISAGLSRIVSNRGMVARLGGDEFAIILSGSSSTVGEKVALKALEFIKKFRLNWQGNRLSVGTSIGLVNIDRAGMTPTALLAVADEALYSAKEAGRGAVYSVLPGAGDSDPPKFKRIDAGTPPPSISARSHEPEDGRRQELYATVMACLPSDEIEEQENRTGSRRRHEIVHWINTEPRTVGDRMSPGMQARELFDDAAARSDGGADLARWVLVKAIDAASRLSQSEIGRIGFVLPVPARAVVTVPNLAEELMRINALAALPLRHITMLLYNVNAVYSSAEIEQFHQRLSLSEVGLGFEIRASTLDVLAPLRHVPYEELHLGRELSKNLRPGTSSYSAVEALLTVADQSGTTLVASGVNTAEEVRHLAVMGVNRFAGPVIAEPKPLHQVLAGLRE